ncbi:hypothetical protein ANCCAN_26572, partial [Ancylostoma caninum]
AKRGHQRTFPRPSANPVAPRCACHFSSCSRKVTTAASWFHYRLQGCPHGAVHCLRHQSAYMVHHHTVDGASTSSGPSADAVLDKTMKILESLVLDWGKKQTVESNSRESKCTNEDGDTARSRQHHPPFWRRRVKWTPYSLPRRISAHVVIDDLYSILCRIHFSEEVDVEILRMCLLDRRDIPVACSVQAARPPTPDGEVDELSEYFAHFVRVDLKMSSLAESMYV